MSKKPFKENSKRKKPSRYILHQKVASSGLFQRGSLNQDDDVGILDCPTRQEVGAVSAVDKILSTPGLTLSASKERCR